jgi:hypothetical protein
MAKQGPETKLVLKMRKAGEAEYGPRLVVLKYHGDQYARAGVSDLLCCLDGVFVACEVKAPESYGKSVERALAEGPTVLQRSFVAKVLAAGGVAGFAATVEQFMDLLAEAAAKATGIGMFESARELMGNVTDEPCF